MKVRGALVVILLLAWAGPSWAARDLCKLLKDKGVLNELEYNECKAAQEKEESADESKMKEFLGVRLPKWVDSIIPFGDVRLRDEMFYGNHYNSRNRFRLRARLGLNIAPTEEISATVRLATGDSNDPISTNQSFERTFTRKSINLDQAYLVLRPGKTFGLEQGRWGNITAGKFSVNAYRTSELVFDDDLTPEGATETFNIADSKEGTLRSLRVSAFQWVIDEIAAANDPWMGGAQVATDLSFGSFANWSAAIADYHYEGMNGVARKFLSTGVTSSTGSSSGNTNRNGQLANSNRVVRDTNGNIQRFESRFNILHVASELNFGNPIGLGFPGGVFGELAHNTQADGKDIAFLIGAGLGKAGKDWYHDSLRAPGDWGVSYMWEWAEQDALPSMFSYSDIDFSVRDGGASRTQKGGTNVMAHILRLDYMLLPNFQLTAKTHFINALDRSEAIVPSGAPLDRKGNATLMRTQLDAVLKF